MTTKTIHSSAAGGWLAALALALGAPACDKGDDDTGGTNNTSKGSASASASSGGSSSSTGVDPSLQWYSTCGDPVCSGYNGPWDGVPACAADQKESYSCAEAGIECDFMNECNARLRCASADPKLQEGGCPISRARFKEGIDYVDGEAREGYYRQLLDLKLATYQYRGAPTPRTHLGVILEDDPAGVWVDGANDRVDLYGYTSLAIAGVQSQADELAALRGELKALRAELAAVKAGRCE
ncbi:MAG: hypothetical protein H6711_00750 [Myxococcales bacterium]|nr:hypothetical protein [Myxococcales bacterium]